MPTSAQVLGKFAAELELSDVPASVAERAKDCIIDTIGIATFGSQLPWGRMVADYARRYGENGLCTLLGYPGTRVHAPYAALANGVFAHAFEHDSFHDPSVGAHPGATVLPAVLAACEETQADGKTALTAFVAGCEVLFRVGKAAHQSGTSPERIGFHAPGLTGPYGAAAAASRIYGLDTEQIGHAMSASTAVQAMRELMSEHRFSGHDVASVVVEGTEKLAHHPHIPEPGDVGQAQYSVPFCVALALFRNPDDPKSFDSSAVADSSIRAICRGVVVRKGNRAWPSAWSTRVIVRLKDGRELTRNGDSANGMLAKPLSRAELRTKFMVVTEAMGETASARLFDRLEHVETEQRFSLA